MEDRELGTRFVVQVWSETGDDDEDAIRGSIHCVDGDQVTFFVGLAQLMRKLPQSVRGKLFGTDSRKDMET